MAFFDKKPKVFVIVCNETGTTSVAEAPRMLDWKVAPQQQAEWLLEDWGRRDFLGVPDQGLKMPHLNTLRDH